MGKAQLTQGKGDKRRPKFISEEELANNWELAFGKKKRSATNEKIENKSGDVKKFLDQ